MCQKSAKSVTCNKFQKPGHASSLCYKALSGQLKKITSKANKVQQKADSLSDDELEHEEHQAAQANTLTCRVSSVRLTDPTPRLYCHVQPAKLSLIHI